MSLINEALKKAQRERDGGNAPAKKDVPSVGGQRPTGGNPADKASFKLMRALIVGGMMLAVLIGAVGLLINALKKTPAPQQAPITEVPVQIKTGTQKTAPPEPSSPPATTPRSADRLANAPSSPPQMQGPEINAPETAPPTSVSQSTQSPAPPPAAPPEPTAPEPAPTVTQASTPTPQPVATAPAPTTANPPAPSSNPEASAPIPPVTPAPATQPSAPTSPQPTQVATAPTTQAPAPIVVPNAPTNLPTDNAPQTQPEIQRLPDQPVSAGAPPAAPEPAPAATTSQAPNPNIIAFLQASRITGIKVAGSKSRVLMNNQVFKVGSIVEAASQLKITAIKNNEIQFVDESGVEYRKQFQR